MTMIEYIKRLRKKKNYYRNVILFFTILGVMLSMILLQIVRNGNKFGIPEVATQYMLNTVFYNFSSSELRQILVAKTGIDTLLTLLLAIYWVYHLSVAIFCVLVPFLTYRSYLKFRKKYFIQGLLDTSALLNSIKIFLRNPSSFNRLKLLSVAKRSTFHYYVSPIRYKWYRTPIHQWLKFTDIDKKSWEIIAALSEFKDALISTINNDLKLQDFIKPIETLQEFYMLVASRSDEKFNVIVSSDNNYSEKDILLIFSKQARPLIIAANQLILQHAKPRKFIIWLTSVLRSQLVRTAGTVSLIAGFVMIIGVLLFQIPYHQAFITWFTVSFGGLSISIGVSSFDISKAPKGD